VQDKKILEVVVERGMQHNQKIVFRGEADEAVRILNAARAGRISALNTFHPCSRKPFLETSSSLSNRRSTPSSSARARPALACLTHEFI
jgi:hypothetical protein